MEHLNTQSDSSSVVVNSREVMEERLRTLDDRPDLLVSVYPLFYKMANREVAPVEITALLVRASAARNSTPIVQRMRQAEAPVFFGDSKTYFNYSAIIHALTEDSRLRGRVSVRYAWLLKAVSEQKRDLVCLRTREDMADQLHTIERHSQLEKGFYAFLLEHAGKTVTVPQATIIVLEALDRMTWDVPDPFARVVLYHWAANKIGAGLVQDATAATNIGTLLRIICDT